MEPEKTTAPSSSGIRLAYQPKLRRLPDPGAPGHTGPLEEVVTAAQRIMARWNEKIPRNHVRVLDQGRFIAIGAALESWPPEQILAAIDYYGRQSWQRKKGAWKKFDNFIQPNVLRGWIEEMLDAAKKAAERQPPADPRIAKLAAELAAKQAIQDEWDALREPFDRLPMAEKKRLLREAAGQLQRLFGKRRPPTMPAIRKRALLILKRQQAAGNGQQIGTRDQGPGTREERK
ncbi:MAG TPA: hypothetical protein VMY35_03705 [Phycisphaerae bacterium]|nr:hypothetical protein [Phycisphaerae bacterium]